MIDERYPIDCLDRWDRTLIGQFLPQRLIGQYRARSRAVGAVPEGESAFQTVRLYLMTLRMASAVTIPAVAFKAPCDLLVGCCEGASSAAVNVRAAPVDIPGSIRTPNDGSVYSIRARLQSFVIAAQPAYEQPRTQPRHARAESARRQPAGQPRLHRRPRAMCLFPASSTLLDVFYSSPESAASPMVRALVPPPLSARGRMLAGRSHGTLDGGWFSKHI